MGVRPINLWNSYNSSSDGYIYYNTSTTKFYSDSACTNRITEVQVPARAQYSFGGYRATDYASGALRISATGKILSSWNPGTGTNEIKIYASWTQVSKKFTIDPNECSPVADWTARTTAFYRSVEPSTHFYADDQLTQEITSILLPYKSGYSCTGIYGSGTPRVYAINTDGTFNTESFIATGSATTDYSLSSIVRFLVCYKLTLNANGGSGGPSSPIWWDRNRTRWCSDDVMLNPITTVEKPTRDGMVFKGYYTATSGGTQVVDADGVLGTYSAVESASKTVYAQWETPVTITLNDGGGSGGAAAVYYAAGKFYDTAELTSAVTSVAVPTLANHRFLGYYSGSTQVIDAAGAISESWTPSSAVTITAQWERVSYTVNIAANGGSGISAVYANAERTALYDDETCSGTPLTGITPLVRAGFRFLGIYATDSAGGTLLVNGDGSFTSAMATFVAGITGTTTIYAKWQQVVTIVLDLQDGTGGASALYYEDAYGTFYDDPAMVTPVSSVAVPERECYAFGGYYTGTGGSGTQCIAASGSIVSGYAPTGNETIYAKWTRRAYKYTLNGNGGTGGSAAIYCDGSTATFYADDALTQTISNIDLPARPGYTFTGYANGGTQVVDASGSIMLVAAFGADATATAGWTANTYTLLFDYNGGSGSTQQKTVTFGQPIGELPTATRNNAVFAAWLVNGSAVTSGTVWNVANNATALAQWDLNFGGVTDWFGFGGANLIPISSSSGDNKQRICVAHYGKFENGVNAVGGIWRNPSVTYQVVRDALFACTLGRAYAGNSSVSGYMIVSASVQTGIGRFPTITVRGVANEGANAINQFPFTVSVQGRARAQNLLNAVTGGGQLQSLTVAASCSPVVIAENNMPCASDVVDGRITATASLYAPNGESAPTASGGFTSVGAPKEGGDKNYTMWNITAEKEM